TSGPAGRQNPHRQAEDMTAPTIKRNAAKKPLISGRRPDMTMPPQAIGVGSDGRLALLQFVKVACQCVLSV
ncbi:MAG: hypothetical protein WA624_21155, partial [Methylocella sp.]